MKNTLSSDKKQVRITLMLTEQTFYMIIAIVYGLVVGSFLNVCIYRMPKNESINGRSYCPKCKKPIPFYRNIPVITYLIQGGKSACCKEPISAVYPLIEALTGVFSLFVFLHMYEGGGFPLDYFVWFSLFICPLIIVSAVDFKLKIIPDQISIPFILVGIAVHVFANYPLWTDALIDSVIGIFAGGGSLLILGFVISKLKGREAMGGGDIKLTAMLGAFLGWRAIIFIFFTSAMLALVYAVFLMIFKRQAEDKTIPFGPFLSMAAVMAFMYGKVITDWYFFNIAHLPFNVLFP